MKTPGFSRAGIIGLLVAIGLLLSTATVSFAVDLQADVTVVAPTLTVAAVTNILVTVTPPGTSQSITLTDFTTFSTLSTGTAIIGVDGKLPFFVGAKASLGAGQPGATYNTNFTVFVDYAP